MNNKNKKNENTDNLLAKFYSQAEAEQIKNDLSFADEAFEKYPAAQPDEQTIMKLKQQMAVKLSSRKHTNLPRVILQTAAVAAVVIAAAVLTLPDKAGRNGAAIQSAVIQLVCESDISQYEDELAQLKNELATLNYNEENGTSGTLLDLTEQVEAEIIETDNTFWKG